MKTTIQTSRGPVRFHSVGEPIAAIEAAPAAHTPTPWTAPSQMPSRLANAQIDNNGRLRLEMSVHDAFAYDAAVNSHASLLAERDALLAQVAKSEELANLNVVARCDAQDKVAALLAERDQLRAALADACPVLFQASREPSGTSEDARKLDRDMALAAFDQARAALALASTEGAKTNTLPNG